VVGVSVGELVSTPTPACFFKVFQGFDIFLKNVDLALTFSGGIPSFFLQRPAPLPRIFIRGFLLGIAGAAMESAGSQP